MNNTFTPEQLMKIFGLYPNAEVKCWSSTTKIHSLSFSHNTINGCTVEDCQLILTSLEDISEEHANSILEKYFPHSSLRKYKILKNDLGVYMSVEGIDMEEHHFSSEIYFYGISYPEADYLREHNYHIPYKGKNLYDEGVAIKPSEI